MMTCTTYNLNILKGNHLYINQPGHDNNFSPKNKTKTEMKKIPKVVGNDQNEPKMD